MHVCMLNCFSHVPVFATLLTEACQAPLSMGFSRQYWNGLPFPPPGDLPDSGIDQRIKSYISCIHRRVLCHECSKIKPGNLQILANKHIINEKCLHFKMDCGKSIYHSYKTSTLIFRLPKVHLSLPKKLLCLLVKWKWCYSLSPTQLFATPGNVAWSFWQKFLAKISTARPHPWSFHLLSTSSSSCTFPDLPSQTVPPQPTCPRTGRDRGHLGRKKENGPLQKEGKQLVPGQRGWFWSPVIFPKFPQFVSGKQS